MPPVPAPLSEADLDRLAALEVRLHDGEGAA
jgi:hypothetical protein